MNAINKELPVDVAAISNEIDYAPDLHTLTMLQLERLPLVADEAERLALRLALQRRRDEIKSSPIPPPRFPNGRW
jgi:hypothetical protein